MRDSGLNHLTSPVISITIDTEEDQWDSYLESGETTLNILELPRVQEIIDRWDARATYLINRAPLIDARAVATLGRLNAHSPVELGGHCHPWNTPPSTGTGVENSMLEELPESSVHAKIRTVRQLIERELGETPISFRGGRWSFGPKVARALFAEGFKVDASVSPFWDWSPYGGNDYSSAPDLPYRFSPEAPFSPDPEGSLIEMPTTVGFLRGNARRSSRHRRRLEASVLAKTGLVGALDRAGILARRWLCPETSSASEMIRLFEAATLDGRSAFDLTFHSGNMLPGATPFVRTKDDRSQFLDRIDQFLRHCSERGVQFRTLGEVGLRLLNDGGVQT
jgi:hypothetical protein